MVVIPPGTGAIPLPAARGTAGTGRPGNPAAPSAASSRRRSSSARRDKQPVPPPTGAGSSRPREPRAGQPGTGPMHARLRPDCQGRRGFPRRGSRRPPASRDTPRAGGDAGRAAEITGGSRRHRAASRPVPAPRAARRAERTGLPPGPGIIWRRLRRACQVRASGQATAGGTAWADVPGHCQRRNGRAGRAPWRGCRCPPRTAHMAAARIRPGVTCLWTGRRPWRAAARGGPVSGGHRTWLPVRRCREPRGSRAGRASRVWCAHGGWSRMPDALADISEIRVARPEFTPRHTSLP
jgi:hypothetical protein